MSEENTDDENEVQPCSAPWRRGGPAASLTEDNANA
jgi:hypothetical protein